MAKSPRCEAVRILRDMHALTHVPGGNFELL